LNGDIAGDFFLTKIQEKRMDLSAIISTLIVLSIASERLVEIVKGFIPALDKETNNPRKESRRKAYLQMLAVIAGIFTAFLARAALGTSVPEAWNTTTGVFALGLLASGGSGLWNSVLGYANEVKKLKKDEVNKEKAKAP
jgi:hypothetical protein